MEEILRLMEEKDWTILSNYQGGPPDLPFELSPEDFMGYAEEDLKESHDWSAVNALSNVKRAIDCRVESLLFVLGVHGKAKRQNWNFPAKVEFLTKVGVAAPNILRKISRKRNEMEHEFKKPTRDDVQDFLDVATLFMHYTQRFVDRTYGGFEWVFDVEHNYVVNIKLDPREEAFTLKAFEKEKEMDARVSVDDEKNYLRVQKHWVRSILTQ